MPICQKDYFFRKTQLQIENSGLVKTCDEHIPRQHICHNIVFMPSFNESSIDWHISFIDSVELSQF